MPSTFDLHDVAEGVWAAVAPGTAGPAVSNAAIIDLGDKTLVVDTFMTVQAAEELTSEVKQLTGRTPHLVVNSHWHSDHVRGNSVFAGTPIVGTQRIRELILADAPRSRAELGQQAQTVIDTAEQLAAQAATPEEQAQAAGTALLGDALKRDAEIYRLVLPDVLVGERLDIEGERSATILGYGKGHTESDLFVHVPDAGVIVAGDLVWTGIHPKTSDGYPSEWVAVIERFDGLGYSHVVPGHGPPGSPADVAAMAEYLSAVAALVDAARAGDVDPLTVNPPLGSEDWASPARFQAGLAGLAAR